MFLWKLQNFIFRITHPSFWFQNYRTSWTYDAQLRKILENPCEVILIDEFHISIDGRTLWIENYPYAYGTSNCCEVLASPLTRVKLSKVVESNLI